ncbi:MAG: carbon-nitrogen hydrolase family protein, partial [Dehalococcoidia bacterium]|nr:carbon-nitrogen hydrolase family protein [Dehalococcoidia bacterium]
ATVDKAVRLIEEAGGQGARLVVFPECWMPSFPYWSMDFTDRLTFREIWARYLLASVEVPGKETKALCTAAKNAGAYVVMGINERDSRFQGRMYNSILYISPQGKILGTHRKICNTVQERFFHTPGDGGENLNTVFNTDIGIIGGTMCGEHAQLGLAQHWIMQGIQIHCSLWPGEIGLETLTDIRSRNICCTARCFGVVASTYISEEDKPKNFYKNSLFNIPKSIRGGSGVIDPNGRYIAGPVYDEAAIVYADIDLFETYKSRFETNVVGIYSRWDLISLNVRQETYEPVVPMKLLPERISVEPPPESRDGLEKRVRRLEQQIASLTEKPEDKGP